MTGSTPKRLLFVQPSFQPPGGGNGVAAWMLQALQDRYAITTLSWRPIDVGPMNDFWGTSIRSDGLTSMHLPRWRTRPIDRAPLPLALLRTSMLMRAARRISGAFDAVVTANNELDVGRRCVQYVHYPAYLRPRPEVDIRWYHHPTVMLDVYYAVADWMSGVSHERIKANVTLVNSDWTGAHYRSRHGCETITLYPPVRGGFPDVPWEARDDTFMAIGRFAPEKDLEKVIDILVLVRRERPDVRLLLVGNRENAGYARRLTARVRREGDWITVREDLPRDELEREVARHRYGLHGMAEEHFGMAPAEMVAAGCVVFVPRGGGQMEIVGDEARLLYDDREDAARKILEVLHDADAQAALRRHLAARRALFTAERFMARIREIVAGVGS